MPSNPQEGVFIKSDHPLTAVIAFDDVLSFTAHCSDCSQRLRIVHINPHDKLVVFTRDEELIKALGYGTTLDDEARGR